jgi:hypothetical protein
MITYRKLKLELRPRLLLGVAGLIAIVAIGMATNEGDLLKGALIGISAAIGAGLGFLFKPEPVREDHSLTANTSLGRMVRAGRALSDKQAVVTELAGSATDSTTKFRLISVQDGLRDVRESLQLAMMDWDEVAPGSTQAVIEGERKAASRWQEMIERDGSD